MRTKHIVTLMVCLFIGFSSEAQLLKKLKKKAEQAAERTILRKTDEAVSKKTEKVLDSITNPKSDNRKTQNDSISDDEKGKAILDVLLSQTPSDSQIETQESGETPNVESIPISPNNNAILPESYQFSYYAIIEVKNDNGTIETDYFLQPNASYYAKELSNIDVAGTVVYDNENNIEVYFFQIEGEKRRAHKTMDFITKANMIGAFKPSEEMKTKTIENKTLLGYECKGFEIESKEGITQFWFTNQAPATVYKSLFDTRATTSDSPFNEQTMIMEAIYTSKVDSAKNYEMRCKTFQPKSMALNSQDYNE